MKISNRTLLPIVILPILLASCNPQPQPIDFGHDLCTLCKKPIDDPAIAAMAIDEEGMQLNFDSIKCLVQQLGQDDTQMSVIKVADYQHPGSMLYASQSYYKLEHVPGGKDQPKALRHKRTRSLCWKSLQAKLLEGTSDYSQNTSSGEEEMENNRSLFMASPAL